ncbi:MAG: ubiquitin fusion degradation protein 1 [Amphiamblys sp. WSBS2006]|nr:MAG: ubiquitin fusion degradation protein 1 [Amphiamblys sp. WSBS2006]
MDTGEDGDFYGEYRCARISRCVFLGEEKIERTQNGGKMFLPESAITGIFETEHQDPMVFQISKENSDETNHTHLGVIEFTAEEGYVYLPDWVFDRLLLSENNFVSVRSVFLPKGESIKIQPLSCDFLEIHDHRAALEHHLKKFTALTEGDVLSFIYHSEVHTINIVETSPGPGILVVETDIAVEFAPPPDYSQAHPAIREMQKYKTAFQCGDTTEEGFFAVSVPDNVLIFYPETENGSETQ